jgi:hypothetical protein
VGCHPPFFFEVIVSVWGFVNVVLLSLPYELRFHNSCMMILFCRFNDVETVNFSGDDDLPFQAKK